MSIGVDDKYSPIREQEQPQMSVRKKKKKKKGKNEKILVAEILMALMLCHNVTPVYDSVSGNPSDLEDDNEFLQTPRGHEGGDRERSPSIGRERKSSVARREIELKKPKRPNLTYQSASPDEIALVKFAEDCGIYLMERDEKHIKI